MHYSAKILSRMVQFITAGMLLLLSINCHSENLPLDLKGQWYKVQQKHWQYQQQYSLEQPGLKQVSGVSQTGGHFLFQTDFVISEAGDYVLDFKNTSLIQHFHHYLFKQDTTLIFDQSGGMGSNAINPFFLHHGREVTLQPGHYRLISELQSPFFLAQPAPYLDQLMHYRQSIKAANALVFICLGIFIGLGVYYAMLAIPRKRLAEGMYALFILGNILFDGSAHLVFTEFFNLHWIYLSSAPILFSNIAYIIFVMALLNIGKQSHPRLYATGITSIVILVFFILFAAVLPNWSMEFARYGVAVFLSYGLLSGIVRTRQGNMSARYYLVAIGCFFLLGGIAITQKQLSGIYTFNIEHLGLFAVTVEVILLALVLAYQFAQLHREKESIMQRLQHSNRIAHTDPLTDLPNRFKLDLELEKLPRNGSLTYIDLDRLKYYNDHYGHARGDELLKLFAQLLADLLAEDASMFRVGGDEFAITSRSGDVATIENALNDTVHSIRNAGFEFAGASAGTAMVAETESASELKHLADQRMYECKQQRKTIQQDAEAASNQASLF